MHSTRKVRQTSGYKVSDDDEKVGNVRLQYTVADALKECGIQEKDTKYLARNIFLDDYKACTYISDSDLERKFKILSKHPTNPIYVCGGQHMKIQAFVLWTKDQIMQGLDPSQTLFPRQDVTELLSQAHYLKRSMEISYSMREVLKPDKFTKDMNWHSWAELFRNYLGTFYGQYDVPLTYVIRDELTTPAGRDTTITKKLVAKAPLVGENFNLDAEYVHFILLHFIRHDEANDVVRAFRPEENGRKDWQVLSEYFNYQMIHVPQATHRFYRKKRKR
jgi:hypothetical protein